MCVCLSDGDGEAGGERAGCGVYAYTDLNSNIGNTETRRPFKIGDPCAFHALVSKDVGNRQQKRMRAHLRLSNEVHTIDVAEKRGGGGHTHLHAHITSQTEYLVC